uniref:Uncharacterized protein n=1 Tax=Candidatus Kentrum sp. SD TaxID=2126332 RepID=A0A451BQG4_9GAMM|nr:MAG: hypothetical protein BECKSD772F_GA0070984_12026 [Candidatus Kentron sp. SD]VFK49627.1 MAG: hypothetical protein BECKSD772E_GA0070983_12046 [Candidatus Kentron sp. SD]VFK80495.1 MAG: hypothetical protein BECKSD772D_GA0070982_11209 [Candidatus Kentron sp. SD]
MDSPNQAETNSFSDRMIDILNGSMLSLMIGIGYKTDLLKP